ncbi:ubiquitin thioesterase OTU1 [Tetranychus urticae]|uniref:Ubiquitin thioesterase OTU n=1 Tax=Tetranychus urticae TaxID=32264 RepID=T1JWX2_TETUR|nr:ubiquitin thioesterase OTU1 [Tetranychus urticae]
MTPKILPLRCKTATGSIQIESLYETSTIKEMKEVISSVTGIHPETLVIRRGFPPIPIDLTDETKPLIEAITSSKEMLIIEGSSADRGSYASKPTPLEPSSFPTKPTRPTQSYNVPVQPSKGVLMRHVVPANNSCLFTSINFCLTNGRYEEASGKFLRQIIAKTVARDPITYNEAFLGKPNRDYVTWILNETHWGGAIEISILSAHYSIEIVVVDTQNTRLNRFGEDKDYANRILVIYDGIHYDPLLLEPSPYGTSKKIQTIFPKSDDIILSLALELAHEARTSRQFTDVQNFTLRCLDCNTALQGQEAARIHAQETGHINFGEI